MDLAHLKAARARLGQVKWLAPDNAESARQHLERKADKNEATTARPLAIDGQTVVLDELHPISIAPVADVCQG